MSRQNSSSFGIEGSAEANAECCDSLLAKTARDEAVNTSAERLASSSIQSMLAPTWRYLWKTSSTIIALFLLAWLFAIVHLILFNTLDHQRTEGPGSVPQNYVATLSHLLGLLFRSCLCGSLAIAYTQYLWRLMRVKAVQVSTIEVLLKMTHNPFLLAIPDVIKTTPTLFVLALLTWILPVAVTFPPGALVVISTPVYGEHTGVVPTYNAAWNITPRTIAPAISQLGGGVHWFRGVHPPIQRMGRLTLESGDIVSFPSPCGLDCAYTIRFEGPYLRCTDSVGRLQPSDTMERVCNVAAFSTELEDSFSGPGTKVNRTTVNMTAIRVVSNPDNITQTTFEVERSCCVPSYALYTVNFTYVGGVRAISHTAEYVSSFDDRINRYLNEEGPNLLRNEGYFSSLNHFAFIAALVEPLRGNYTMTASGSFSFSPNGATSRQPCNITVGNIVGDTRFNIQKENYTRPYSSGPEFRVSEDIINEALFNSTISAALQLGYWSDNATMRITSYVNVYSFAKPLQIIAPYLACLLASLPFLVLGIVSLRRNGVSAIQGGFLQMLMTTIGGKALEKAAAGGSCLGGEENIPDELKRLKVQFGEILADCNDASSIVRRAGFGTEDEVIPLRYGISYSRGSL